MLQITLLKPDFSCLFQFVDETCRQDGVVFVWHPEFDDQASMVMSGLLPYLKTEYGDSVIQYFNEDCITMIDLQKWDKDKGGIINEDDAMLSKFAQLSLWWEAKETVCAGLTQATPSIGTCGAQLEL